MSHTTCDPYVLLRRKGDQLSFTGFKTLEELAAHVDRLLERPDYAERQESLRQLLTLLKATRPTLPMDAVDSARWDAAAATLRGEVQ